MGANGSKAPRSPNKPSVLQHENSLTDTIRRAVSKHGDSTKKISEKRDFRQSLAKAQLVMNSERPTLLLQLMCFIGNVFFESASEGFSLSMPFPGGVDRAGPGAGQWKRAVGCNHEEGWTCMEVNTTG